MKKLEDVHGKILVADDEKLNVDFFQVMLTKLGFEVEIAFDGEEVLEKVKKSLPDLILLDLRMPKISGYDVAQILKGDERTKNIPIIVLTAVHDIQDKVEMIELGIEDYITKPFNFVEILARIRNNLKAKFLRDEMVSREGRLLSVARLEESFVHFLDEAQDCTDKIHESIAELKHGDYGKKENLQRIEGEITRLLQRIDEVRLAFQAHVNACK